MHSGLRLTVSKRALQWQLHSVPRPSSRYFYEEGDEDEDDDEEGDVFETIERAVLLFNTWDDPPKDAVVSSTSDNDWFTVDNEDDLASSSVTSQGPEEQRDSSEIRVGSRSVAPSRSTLRCRPRADWVHVPISRHSCTGSKEACLLGVPLLGGKFRRGRVANALAFIAPQQAAHSAFESESAPLIFPVKEMINEVD